ncbi:MAG: hypothetical protein K2H76_08695 [Muribaculaceae bacterium]|nr:hypothetical protein [Muribaculaceae bacterium]
MSKKLYIFPVLLLLLTGCINDYQPVCDKVEAHMVSFSLSVDKDGTRSGDETWSGGYEDEEGFEWDQTISTSPDSIHPVLYDVNDKDEIITSNPAGEIKNVIVTYDKTEKCYNVSGKLETNKTLSMLQNGKFRLVIYANMKDYDAKNPMSEQAEFTRHGAPGSGTSDDELKHVPMFGVGVANLSQVGTQTGVTQYTILDSSGNPLNIPMLRAMAKVRVKIAEDLRNVIDLKEISINRHAQSGYIVPNSWNKISSVYEIPLNQTMNAKTNNNHTCTTTINPETDKTNNRDKLRFFIPETFNKDNDGVTGSTDLSLTIKYVYIKCEQDASKKDDEHGHTEVSEPVEQTIYFRQYLNGKPNMDVAPYDIIRNHVYDFTINGVANNFELLMDLSIYKWKYHKLGTEL